MTCNAEGTACVSCVFDDDCGDGAWCNAGSCEPCDDVSRCGPDCLACSTPPDVFCFGGVTGGCGECAVDGDCVSTAWCNVGVCEICAGDDPLHCGTDCAVCGSATPFCQGGICTECTADDNCPAWQYCGASSVCEDCGDTDPEHCGTGCADCTSTAMPWCTSGSCVECLDNTHCDANEFCNASNTCELDSCPISVWTGSYSVSTAAHILALAGITEITGDLTVTGSSLTSLTGLECLNQVGGYVRIYNSYSLQTLAGLENLGTIGGYLRISGNTVLTTITNIESLDHIGVTSALDVYNNSSLPTCEAENLRDHLMSFGWTGTAYISGNNDLGTCE
jgi:hypothetical protein